MEYFKPFPDNVLNITSKGLFFKFYFEGTFGWQDLSGPYRNHFIKTPEDLIESLTKLNWSDDEHCAHVLTMDAYLELEMSRYNRAQDLCVFKLYSETTPKIIVVKEKKLGTYQELAWRDFDKKLITTENQNRPAITRGLAVRLIGPNSLVVHKDDLHRMFPRKTKRMAPEISALFRPNIKLVADAKVHEK